MTLTPGDSVGPYRVIAPLGSGGHADVYRVQHSRLRTHHALKLLHQTSAEVKERLLREGRTQRALKHPNLVAVTEIVEHNGQPGLIMEYVTGPDLSTLIARGPMPIHQADLMIRGILAGIGHAHAHGVIHRDIKPTNILIENGVPRICDFGIAKLIDGDAIESGHTRTGSALGTPAYMAPEQIRDARRVDRRADVYSLGAVIYEVLTGQPAYPGDDLLEVFTAIASGDFVPVQQRVPGVPRRMIDAINQSLVFDPDQRVHTAAMLLEVWTKPNRELAPAPLSLVRTTTPLPRDGLRAPGRHAPTPPPARQRSQAPRHSRNWGLVALITAAIITTATAAALAMGGRVASAEPVASASPRIHQPPARPSQD